MKFNYQAVNRDGSRLAGELDASSQADALRQLEKQGLTPIHIARPVARTRTVRRRLTPEDVNMALFELATMLRAGVSMVDAVVAQQNGDHHPQIETAMEAMANGLRQGESFSQVLEGAALPLPSYVYHLVAAGEMTGALADALQSAVDQLEYDRQTREELRSALVYPAILIGSGIAAVAIMFVFVVPNFINLLEQAEKLPWLAWAVLSAGAWTNSNGELLMLVTLALALALGFAVGEPRLRERALNGCLKIPLLGDWLLQSETAQWAKVLGNLLRNKVPLVEALSLSQRGSRLLRQRNLLALVIQDVRGGDALSASLESRRVISDTGTNLIRVGEKSGQLPTMLDSLALLYEQSSRSRVRKFLALIEPIAILTIGAMFGVIIAGVILAITSANDLAI